jgi:hypothetical protein
VILGKYVSVEALEEAVTDPEVGDAYDVGTDTLYTYIWDGENWVSHGDIRGVGIESVEQVQESTVSGGVNVVRVTKTDGTTSDFSVRNGAKGERGVPGNVHYGSDAPPSDAVIWIDPSGEPNVVEQIMQAADNAAASAEAASVASNNARSAKDEAAFHAAAASNSRSAAASSASSAASAASAASSSATAAAGSASSAASSASNASSSAAAASASEAAAQSAKTDAEAASTAAQAAQTAAEAAADAAQDTVYLTNEDDGDTRYTMAWSVRGGLSRADAYAD